MDNLVNVVVGAVVDASVYAFAPQTVIVLFASLDVIFNAIYFTQPFWKWHNKKAIRTKAYASSCFVLQSCPHGDRHFDVEGLLILQKGDRVALGIIGGCSMDNVFFLELFVGVVQILINSLFRATKFPKLFCPDNCLRCG